MRKRSSHRRQLWAERLILAVLVATLAVVVTARSGAGRGQEEASQPPQVAQTPIPTVNIIEALSTPSSQATAAPAEPTSAWELPAENRPARIARYSRIDMTAEEREELAAIVYLEAGNQSAEGQQAVVEVVFNRVLHEGFPDAIHDVLHQGEGTDLLQFTTIVNLHLAKPTQAQYDAIDAALYGESILPMDVVFFSRGGENDRVWGKIGDHVFCREYIWG